MKYVKYLLILFFIPYIVVAEECDVSKITITSIEQKGIEGNAKELDNPEVKDRDIKLSLKMYDVGDSITYDMTIKNDSEEDYMIDEDTFKTDSEYIEYTLRTNDNSNVVKAKNTKNVTLTVTYRKEVDESLLTNNKFNASNSLKLTLNTNEKEQTLDVITTDNIKESVAPQEVKNPLTNVNNINVLIIILLTLIAIIYLIVHSKKKYNKYLIIILSMSLIPMVYAICKCDIDVESTIEIEHIPSLYKDLINLSKEENSCMPKYEGQVTDQVGQTVTATNVYFDKCADKRNIIFGGFCWQVIRTTETGGTKIIYNGEPVDGKCESTRENHKGIVGRIGSTQNLGSEYLYGSSFTYDTTNNNFTLIDTSTATWSDLTYENLLGKFTCKNLTGTCTTLYGVNGYKDTTNAYISSYTIGDTNYAGIGTSPFNADIASPALVGYMFNKVYNVKNKSISGTNKFGNTFTYANGIYTLSGTTQDLTTLEDVNINNTHYTCWNDTGTCNNISYVYYIRDNSRGYYIEISDGKNITDAINEMLYDNNINRYNSGIKGIIDSWYSQNLSNKSNMLEDTVFCNARDITTLGGWNPNGGSTTTDYKIEFKNFILNYNNDISCTNETDQFALGNDKAKLTYPVALATGGELFTLTNNNSSLYYDILTKTSVRWWSLSPSSLSYEYVLVRSVYIDGNVNNGGSVNSNNGVRPVASLSSSAVISSGTGSEVDPWIIE